MKKFTLKNILLSFAILLAFCSILILPTGGEIEKISSYASYARVATAGAATSSSQDAMFSPDGNIPFSLYTSLPTDSGTTYDIVDYYPTFTASTRNQGATSINYYSMDSDSVPYILLSSNNTHEDLYTTTLFFKFNDQTFKGMGVDENTIPTQAGHMAVTATINGTQISAPINTSNATTDDATFEFAINLKSLEDPNGNVHCPTLLDGTLLGGDINNDVSFRTGLYSFQIRYTYKDSVSNVSNECVFEISFYVLDYNSYVEDTSPIAFDNTDTVYYDNGGIQTDSNNEIFNYNYVNSPVVWVDATKFALNFVYTTGYTNYAFDYNTFSYSLNCTPDKVFENANIGDKTGTVTLKLKDSDLTYTVYTYMQYAKNKNGIVNTDVVIPYYAMFDLKDFETNFLVKNKINTTFLGQYAFDLDFLVQNSTGYSVFSNDKFDNYPAEINSQNLALFGYNLKYYDQDSSSATYGQNVELKNDVTHTNFIAYNSATSEKSLGADTGALKDIPEYMAVTNQAPLRFDYYGNLSIDSISYAAKFYNIDYKNSNAYTETFDYFDIEYLSDLSTLDAKLTSTYTQGASISNDGIRIMKLVYGLTIDINGISETINGCQYVVFEINNTVQNLYIQGVDYEGGRIQTIYDFKDFTNKNVVVSIEDKPNTFFAPYNVTYNYYPSYDTTGSYTTGQLSLKRNGGATGPKEVLTLSDKEYNYYVTSNSNNFTFTNSGSYRVCIKNSITNTPSYYYFTIDKENFSNISINKASLNIDGTQYSLDSAISNSLLTSSNNYVNTDLVVTNSAFTLGWGEKDSGADSFSYVYYMDINKQNDLEGNLLKNNAEYWITNGRLISSPSSAIDTFKNHNLRPYLEGGYKVLDKSEYFTKDGLYVFYVYDEAGNFFTRTILLDTSKSTILQGKWVDDEGNTIGYQEDSTWVNTYDPENNPSNYVDEDTTLYFGTHKALQLPDLSSNSGEVSFEDISFTREYAYNQDIFKFEALASKTPIEFDIYDDILACFRKFVKADTDASVLIGAEGASPAYYLTVANNTVEYFREYEIGNDETGAGIVAEVRGTLSDIKSATIYKIQNPTDIYNFYGEAYYKFDLENANGSSLTNGDKDSGAVSARIIQMNFDKIQGTFKAYGNSEGDVTEHEIRKNSGTNLNVLNFEYKNLEGDMAAYYSVASLTFDYYAFVLDNSSTNSSKSAYPFALEISGSGDLLTGKVVNGDKTRINAINIDASGNTMPGKYILTRTYVGGTHEFVDGEYIKVGTGGSYVPQLDEQGNPILDDYGNPKYENLFEFDTLVRRYTVYVDHNGIITTSYMVRNDGIDNIREVGDNISITLSNTYDDEWEFKEFFLTSSSTLALDTNKVPVKINIPLSKYFVYFYSSSNNQYAKQSFARLEIRIIYYASEYSPAVYYTIDGFDSSTGLCTCSKLVSATNPAGQLIFSASGKYFIEINDRTGYTDATSSDADADNKYPTTYSYSFSISHTAPEASAYSDTYFIQDGEFELNKLTNEDNSTNFATNIKKVNGDLDGNGTVEDSENNQVLISWSDPLTPYQAKVNQFDVKVLDKNNLIVKTISIDLKNYQSSFVNVAQGIITAEEQLTLSEEEKQARVKKYLPISEEYILYFKVVPYRELVLSNDLIEDSDPDKNTLNVSTYDHKQYYRYTYIVNLDISDEYKYEVTLSYISDSTTNQEYEDENGNSFATSLYTVTIDRTKPNTNVDKLLNEEAYLVSSAYYSSDNLKNFKEENFEVSALLETTPSAFTYAFGVSDNFSLTYNSSDTAPYFYVRGYDKFNDEYTSITPDMIDSVYEVSKAYYTDFTNFSVNYPRFAEGYTNDKGVSIGDNIWYKINYQAGKSLKQLISTATENSASGFYEIIEKDRAGNYRNYTVYFNKYASIYQNLEIDGYTQKDNVVNLVSNGDDAQSDNISAGVFFETTKVSSTLGWGTITVTNTTTSVTYNQEIRITPFDDYDDIVNQLDALNTFLECELSSKLTFKLKKYNSTFTEPSLTRHVNLLVAGDVDRLERPVIEKVVGANNTTTYNLVLPVYNGKNVLYLEEFTLQQLSVNNTWTIMPNYSFVGKDTIPAKIYGLAKGTYKAIYKDNFNNEPYSYPLYVGEDYITDFNKAYSFEFGTYYSTSEELATGNTETVYYSGGYIDVTYEANIYKVYLSINNGAETLISGTNLETNSSSLLNCKTFRLSPSLLYGGIDAETPVGGIDTFTLVYVDITDNSIIQKTVNFAIFNALPQIYLTNAYGNPVTSNLQESDSDIAQSIVTISWNVLNKKANEYDYSYLDDELTQLVATLYTRGENGEYKNGIRLNESQNGKQTVNEEGFYKLTLGNKTLGNFREIYFAISFDDVPLYTVKQDNEKLSASSYEKLDFTVKSDPSSPNDNNGYPEEELIKTIYTAIKNIADIPENERRLLCRQLGFDYDTDVFTLKNSVCNLTNIKHYYTTGSATISYNRNMELNVAEFVFRNNELWLSYFVDDLDNDNTREDYLQTGISAKNKTPLNVNGNYYTTIFLLYNLNGPIKVEFFALTKVPKTSALINTLSYKNEVAGRDSSNVLQANPITTTLTNAEIVNSDIILYWNALPNSSNISWYNAGNVTVVEDTYGVETQANRLECTTDTNNSTRLTTTLAGSGLHKLVFKDLAGNVHEFAPTSYSPQKYYSVLLIDSVIYNIRYQEKDINAIQYGVFNESLSIVLNSEYLTLYSSLDVVVSRNGNSYNGHEINENVYTFTTPGRYTVTMSASYGTQALKNAVYNFTILSSNSARLAYEFVEIAGYEIVEVTRNGQDITSSFDTDGDGKVLALFVSSTSGGNGYYSVKLKYGTKETQILQFNFTINDYVPTISSNVAHGETTQGSIIISYNPSIIFEQLGECYIKVLTYNNDSKTFFNFATVTIDENSFTSTNAKSFEITRSNSYFIQVETKNGNVISSFRVNKTDPLNTMAIIIIVIAVIAAVVLIIVIIKLRTKMKIR